MTYKEAFKKTKPLLLFEPAANEFYYVFNSKEKGFLNYLNFSSIGFSRARHLDSYEWELRGWSSATEEPIVKLEIAKFSIKDLFTHPDVIKEIFS